MKLLRARYIAPMDRPLIADGAVVVKGGRIVEVGPWLELARRYSTAERVDVGNALLLPGLINAHTHLELSDQSPIESAGSFVEWLVRVISSRAALGEEIGPAAAEAARMGAAESLRFGVTCVGDISRFAAFTRPALADSPLRVVSFGEVQAMAGRRHLLESRLVEATAMEQDDWSGPSRLRVAVTPHAPYSVEPEGYSACLAWAARYARPITTHLAETPDEAAFLRDHTGPLREIWHLLRDWREDVPTYAHGPIRLAESLGLLRHPTLLAHVNYADDAELELLAGGKASVVWCPRTHAYFAHRPHRFREMLERGVNVCVGTDSRASSPDLNVVEDVRLIAGLHPDLPAETLWEMVTSRAAAALGLADQLGTLSPGKWADFAAFPVSGRDPLREVLEERIKPNAVWIGGSVIG